MKLLSLLLLFSFSVKASTEQVLNESVALIDWLTSHQKDFANCVPKKVGTNFELCDKTLVPEKDLKEMFLLSPTDLITRFNGLNLKTEILCDETPHKTDPFAKGCKLKSSNSMFKEVTSLHGKYVPLEKTILIRSSASKGSLIHEYIHSLQSENLNQVYGKVYKQERNRLQKELTQIMDSKIEIIKDLESKNKKSEISQHLKEFMLASQVMRHFAPWQDLIDERSIFLLYLKFGKELGAEDADLELAKLNMKHICRNEKLKIILPLDQCESK